MSTQRNLLLIALVVIISACNLSNTGQPRFTTPTVPASEEPETVVTSLPTLQATPTQLFVVTLTPLFNDNIVSVEQAVGYTGIDLPLPGSTAIVFVANDRLSVHDNPGDQYGIVATLQSFAQVEVLEGPQQVGAKTWWKIRFPGGEGWVAGLGEMPYQTLVPAGDFRFCSNTPLAVGGQADVFSLDGALSLFSAPTTTARVLTEMPVNTRVNVTSGAQSVGQNTWYGVRYTDLTGRAWDGFAVSRSNNFCTLHPVI
jgi:hypothetical protein